MRKKGYVWISLAVFVCLLLVTMLFVTKSLRSADTVSTDDSTTAPTATVTEVTPIAKSTIATTPKVTPTVKATDEPLSYSNLYDGSGLTSLVIQSGDTGLCSTITDQTVINEFLKLFRNASFVLDRSEGTVGWSWRYFAYQNDTEKFSFTSGGISFYNIGSDAGLNGNYRAFNVPVDDVKKFTEKYFDQYH